MRRNGRTLVAYFVASRSFPFLSRLVPSPFVSLPPLHLATLGSVPEETNGMSEERRETERKVEWRDEWKGTACDSSLKSLPVSVVHPQILGIACQLAPVRIVVCRARHSSLVSYPPHSLRTEPKVNGSNWSEM